MASDDTIELVASAARTTVTEIRSVIVFGVSEGEAEPEPMLVLLINGELALYFGLEAIDALDGMFKEVPKRTKGREKIEAELHRLMRLTVSLGVECPDCGGTGIGPTVVPAPGESAETGWCPICEGGGSVTKEYMRLRNKKE